MLIFFEFAKRKQAIHTYAQNLRIYPVKLCNVVTNRAKFGRAHTSKGQGEKQQYHWLTLKTAKGYFLLFGIKKGKIGGYLPNL